MQAHRRASEPVEQQTPAKKSQPANASNTRRHPLLPPGRYCVRHQLRRAAAPPEKIRAATVSNSTCTFVCMAYMCAYVCVYFMYSCMHACLPADVCISMRICMSGCLHTYQYVYVRTYMRMCMHTRMYRSIMHLGGDGQRGSLCIALNCRTSPLSA